MPLPSALATTSIDALRAHCAAGTTVRAFQRIDEQPLRRWSLMLHASTAPHVYRPPPLSTQTNAAPMLPWSAHWAFFQGFDGGEFPLARASSDGLLPVLDARRRWAGGSFAFAVSKDCYERNINSMCMSDLVERRTRIASVQEKRGRSGRFAVVGIRDNYHVRARVSSDSAHSMRQLDTSFHDPARSTLNKVLSEVFHELSEMGDGFAGNSDPAMTEIREIVYPLQPFAAAVAAQPLPQPSTVHAPALGADTVVAESTPGGLFAKCNVVHMVRPSTDLLFRFSSLTGNTHRIHYDADYARREEGLSGVLVHGPLSVTLACDALQAHVAASLDETATRLARITYRNLIPLVCNECMFIGISLGDQVATAALKHVSSVDSATGFHRSVWERLSPSAPTRLSVATVSIWNAQKQLAVTLRAEFAKLPPKL